MAKIGPAYDCTVDVRKRIVTDGSSPHRKARTRRCQAGFLHFMGMGRLDAS